MKFVMLLLAAVAFAQAPTDGPKEPPPIRLDVAVVSRLCEVAETFAKAAPESQFLTSDPEACMVIHYFGGNMGDKVRFEWINPLGTVMQAHESENMFAGPHADSIKSDVFRLEGNAAAATMGEWHARLLYNGAGMVDIPFHISQPTPSALELVSPVVLPRGTVGAPYFYRITVRGGTPPYSFTAGSRLPDGMSLSTVGVISGTPTQRRGSQFAVTVQDKGGNQLTRTVAFGAALAPRIHPVPRQLAGSLTNAAGCAGGPNITEFSSKQPVLTLDFTVKGMGNRTNDERWLKAVEWLNPSGDVVFRTFLQKHGEDEECFRRVLPLAKQAEVPAGKWRVRVIWFGGEAFSIPFTIYSDDAPKVVPGRLALVIGNGDYRHMPAIPSAAKDVELMEKALRKDGFEVTAKVNLDLEEWRRVERDFVGKVQKQGVAVVYYAGHGLHEGAENWLVPVNYDPGDRGPLSTKAYSLVRLRQLLEEKEVDLKVLFLNGSGFASPKADAHTVFCLAAPSQAMGDGASLFAQALAKVIDQDNSDLSQLNSELGKALEGQRPTVLMMNPPAFKWR